MKRRIFSVLLSSALLLTALAGCGQGAKRLQAEARPTQTVKRVRGMS